MRYAPASGILPTSFSGSVASPNSLHHRTFVETRIGCACLTFSSLYRKPSDLDPNVTQIPLGPSVTDPPHLSTR